MVHATCSLCIRAQRRSMGFEFPGDRVGARVNARHISQLGNGRAGFRHRQRLAFTRGTVRGVNLNV